MGPGSYVRRSDETDAEEFIVTSLLATDSDLGTNLFKAFLTFSCRRKHSTRGRLDVRTTYPENVQCSCAAGLWYDGYVSVTLWKWTRDSRFFMAIFCRYNMLVGAASAADLEELAREIGRGSLALVPVSLSLLACRSFVLNSL